MNISFHLVTLFVLTAFAYLVGSIPTGYWLCHYFFNLDITKQGSGNIGATNVARVLGKRWFFIVFLIDALKAYAALTFCVLLSARYLESTNDSWLYIFSLAILVGNAFSPFLGFKGGKGVATSLGIFAYLLPSQLTLLFAVSWLILLKLTEKPFIASLVSVVAIILLYWGLRYGPHTGFLLGIFLWISFRHLPNICMWYRTKSNTNH